MYRANTQSFSNINSDLYYTEPQIHLGINGKFVEGFPIWLIPGDPSRARKIYESLDERLDSIASNRGLFSGKGYINSNKGNIPIGVTTSGMGTSSFEITIFRELAPLAILFNNPDYPCTFIRVGSSGSKNPEIYAGDLVIASVAYPFDGATRDFNPQDSTVPLPSDEYLVKKTQSAGKVLGLSRIHTGAVISKATLTSEDQNSLALPLVLETSEMLAERDNYLASIGVLASEMEQAMLNLTGIIYNKNYGYVLRSGGIMAIVNNPRNMEDASPLNGLFGKKEIIEEAEQSAIKLALETSELIYVEDVLNNW